MAPENFWKPGIITSPSSADLSTFLSLCSWESLSRSPKYSMEVTLHFSHWKTKSKAEQTPISLFYSCIFKVCILSKWQNFFLGYYTCISTALNQRGKKSESAAVAGAQPLLEVWWVNPYWEISGCFYLLSPPCTTSPGKCVHREYELCRGKHCWVSQSPCAPARAPAICGLLQRTHSSVLVISTA